MKKEYELGEEHLQLIRGARGTKSRAAREYEKSLWEVFGYEMGFDPSTVELIPGKDPKHFIAESTEEAESGTNEKSEISSDLESRVLAHIDWWDTMADGLIERCQTHAPLQIDAVHAAFAIRDTLKAVMSGKSSVGVAKEYFPAAVVKESEAITKILEADHQRRQNDSQCEEQETAKKMSEVTREEFERDYAQRCGTTIEYLRELGFDAERCDCNESSCRGWKMIHKSCKPPHKTEGPPGGPERLAEKHSSVPRS